MKTRISILVVAVAVVLLGLFISRQAGAIPGISVEPRPFDIAVPAGRQLSTQFTFTSTYRILKPLPLTVSSNLAPYVASIEPAILGAPSPFPSGTTTIKVVFEVATGTPDGIVEGELRFGEKSLLPMKLTISDLLYPPDPGEAGKETLEGIDSDEDGIRDDLQRYIEMTYSDEAIVRAGIRQAAVPLQNVLLDSANKGKVIQHHGESGRAQECLRALLGIERTYQILYAFQAEMLDTSERSQAYLRYNKQLSGEIFGGPSVDKPSACNFNVKDLQEGGR